VQLLRGTSYIVLGITLLAATAAHSATTQSRNPNAEDFTGVLVDTGGADSVPITLHVDAFTGATRVENLAHVVGDKGQSAAVSALEHMKPTGWIRVGKLLGYQVPIIRSFTTPKGQKIVAVLDRPIELWDQLQVTRSPDYPYGMVELDLDNSGNGNGRLIAATRAMFTSDGKIEMESYGTKPFRIIGVTEQAAHQ
jgi:hypothetical protein